MEDFNLIIDRNIKLKLFNLIVKIYFRKSRRIAQLCIKFVLSRTNKENVHKHI